VWERAAERRFLFVTFWNGADAVRRWVLNDFWEAAVGAMRTVRLEG